jgi:CheY-like chemotaxis protein
LFYKEFDEMTQTVLHADDDELMCQIVALVLETAGYETISARNGHDALRLAHTFDIGLAIMDMEMPGMDGLELLRRFKRDERLAGVPVLFMSVHDPIDPRIQAGFEAGAAGYISKGHLDLTHLPGVVRDYMAEHRLVQV